MVSVQPSKNVTGERYGNLRSGNVTWEHLRNQAICETKNLFVSNSNTHQCLVVIILSS